MKRQDSKSLRTHTETHRDTHRDTQRQRERETHTDRCAHAGRQAGMHAEAIAVVEQEDGHEEMHRDIDY